MKRLIVGITGASAGIYGVRLLEVLTKHEDIEVHLTISSSGARALSEELQIEVDLDDFKLESLIGISSPRVVYHHESDIAAPIASGSFRTEGMIVAPCSMGSVASIAGGMSRNLIQRAADVCIKENRKTCACPARNTLELNSFGKHAQIVAYGSLCVASDAGVLSLPKKCGRSPQLHCHKNLGSVWHRYEAYSEVERIDFLMRIYAESEYLEERMEDRKNGRMGPQSSDSIKKGKNFT